MATIKAKIQSLINKANNTTGKSDTDLTNAVKSLAEGYGQGGEPWDETDPDNIIIEGEPTDGDTLTEFLKVRGCRYLFYYCTFVEAPWMDTTTVTDMSYMFAECGSMRSAPSYNTSNVTTMVNMFYRCGEMLSAPLLDTSKVQNMYATFQECMGMTTVPAWDMRAVTNTYTMFRYCYKLTDMRIRNIKTSLEVASGTSWGHLLTVDSLVHLIYELRKQSSALTLTVGSANLAKLANVYVKAIDITDDMRAEDDLIDEKYPFVVCESTDEGAMLITTYASTVKNWTIK